MGCAGTIRENIDKLFMEGTKQSRALPQSVYCYRTIGKELLLSASTRSGSK